MRFISQQRRAERRRRLRGVALGLGGIGLILPLAGFLLPAERVTTDIASVPRSPDAVWRVLTDLDEMPSWRSDVVALERLPDQGGRVAWREVGRRASRVVEFTQSEPPRLLVMRGAGPGDEGGPVRTLELRGTPAGTRVTVTDRVVIPNPLLRLVRRLLPGPNPAGQFLRDLDHRLSPGRPLVASRTG